MSNFIITNSGLQVDLESPDPGTIQLGDIIRHLSQINRYTGATKWPYSVAEHAVRVARFIHEHGGDEMTVLLALHHDDAEAYLGDVSTPLKDLSPEYREREARFERVIHTALELPKPTADQQAIIQEADLALLHYEWSALMPDPGGLQIGHMPEDAKPGRWSEYPLGWKHHSAQEWFTYTHYHYGGI